MERYMSAAKKKSEADQAVITPELLNSASQIVETIAREVSRGNIGAIPSDLIQAMLAAGCRAYAAKIESGEDFLPVSPEGNVTSTDVMFTSSGLLQAVDLQVFELGMWQSWTGR
jgi:hypothetical protein